MIMSTKEVLDLFEKVLTVESSNHDWADLDDALTAVRNTYKALSRDKEDVSIDFNQAECRYAYIYYFAACHTLLVTRQVSRILLKNPSIFCDFMGYEKVKLDICSLGGGPGCDLIGLLRLRGAVGLGKTKKVNCTVVDVSSGWQHSLKYLLKAYMEASEGSMYRGKLNFELIRSNLLLLPPKRSALKRIAAADILTLVKFVSAILAENTSDILEYIFGLMKPGAYVFFSDNGSGDAHKIITAAAIKAGLTGVMPLEFHPEKVSKKRLPPIGPLKISQRPLEYTYACSAVWKK